MLIHSQPLDSKVSKRLGISDAGKSYDKKVVKEQYIGDMFGRLSNRKCDKCIKTRLRWKWYRIKEAYRNITWAIRNHIKWGKTMLRLRSWEGFDGMLTAMITHLRDYIRMEEKYGHAVEEYKNNKIATAKETVKLLTRMRDPDGYWIRLTDAVEKRYPEYKNLVEEYEDGGVSYSGDYTSQGNGWVGSGGYFEFVNGQFERVDSPNQDETDRLIAEIKQYHEEMDNAYKQAEIDSEKDFERLSLLLKENLYSWWD